MTLAELTQTHGWKNFMAKLYGIGAAVVIIGALFKIMHWPGASPMLVLGLGVEALIFFFSAFEPVHEELDWTLVYPELVGLGENDEIAIDSRKNKNQISTSGQALAKFDEMLEKSGGANLFEKLGSGLNNLNTSVKQMTDLSNATVATTEYATSMKTASASANKLSDSLNKSSESLNYSVEALADTYNKTSQSVKENNNNFVAAYKKLTDNMNVDFSALQNGNKEYSTSITSLNKNLSAINAIFEIQLKEVDFEKMIQELNGSVQYSKKYGEEVSRLGKRLEALNSVYGKMLTALNVKVD